MPWGWLIFEEFFIVDKVLLMPVSVPAFAARQAFGLGIGFSLVVVSATFIANLAF